MRSYVLQLSQFINWWHFCLAPAVVTFGNLGGVKPLYRMLCYRGPCVERQLAVEILDKVAENGTEQKLRCSKSGY